MNLITAAVSSLPKKTRHLLKQFCCGWFSGARAQVWGPAWAGLLRGNQLQFFGLPLRIPRQHNQSTAITVTGEGTGIAA